MITIDCPNCGKPVSIHEKKHWPGQEPEAQCGHCGALVTGDADGAMARTGHGLVGHFRIKTAKEDDAMSATLIGATPRLWNLQPGTTREERKYGKHVRKPWHKYDAAYYPSGMRPDVGGGFVLTAYDENGQVREVIDVPEAILAEMESARSRHAPAKRAE